MNRTFLQYGKLTLAACAMAGSLMLSGCGQAEATAADGRMAALEARVETLEHELEAVSVQAGKTDELDERLTGLRSQMMELKEQRDKAVEERLALSRQLHDLQEGSQEAAKPADTSAGPPVADYTDIAGVWGEEAIRDLAALGLFESTSGEFHPTGTITRAQFVRWLVTTNNRYAELVGNRDVIRLAEHDQSTFHDVPADHPDFAYIQGMVDAGFVIGYDETTFAPDRPLSREELVAIKSAVDYSGNQVSETPGVNWVDADKISKRYYGAFAWDRYLYSPNIPRTFGSFRAFRPQQPVTRAEAALCLTAITNHANICSGPGHVTVADALAQLQATH